MILMGSIDVGSQEIRLAKFRDQHPEWRIFPSEFGTWQAERDTDHGSDTHVRYQLGDLLDDLEQKYRPPVPNREPLVG
jgi:hypothetical protein